MRLRPHQIVLVVNATTGQIAAAYTPSHLGPVEFIVVKVSEHGAIETRQMWDSDPMFVPDDIATAVTQYLADQASDEATMRGGNHG